MSLRIASASAGEQQLAPNASSFWRRVLPVVLVVATAPLTQACDTGLQAKLYEARDKRYKNAKDAVYAVEVARNKAMADSLPAADAKFEGESHPMMSWRKNGATRPDALALNALANSAKPLKGATVGAKGTPAESAAQVGSGYLKDAGEFWTGTTTLSRYMTSIGNFDTAASRARSEAEEKAKATKGWEFVEPPFGDEARFDQWFVHAASYLQLSNLSDRSAAWDAMHPAYGIAFGISRRQGEGSSDFISRLCFMHDNLKEKCKGVPHEFRSALVDRGFLEVMLGWAKSYRAKTERAKIFDDVAKRFADAIEAAIATPLAFKEELVLPSTTAAIGGRSGVRVIFSETTGISAVTDAEVKLAEKWTGNIPATLGADIAKLITDLKDKPGNRIDYQRVVLEMAGSTSVATLFQTLKLFPAKLGEAGGGVKDVFLVGRRRIDESMRLSAIKVRIPAADDSPNMGYKFKEDAAPSTCLVVGRVGDPPAGKKDEFDIELKQNQIRAAQVTFDEKTAERIYGDTANLGTMADLTQLKAWLDAHPGRMRLFVPLKGDYNQLSTLLSDLLFKCVDEEVSTDDTTKPKVMRTCGISEPRANSFVLGLCE